MNKQTQIITDVEEELMLLNHLNQGGIQELTDRHIVPFRVLYVEDSPPAVSLFKMRMRNCFEDQGVEIVHVKSLAKALKVLSRTSIDVIVTDLNLPDSHESNTVEAITMAFPKIPTIVLTATSEPRVVVNCFHSGAKDFFIKQKIKYQELADSFWKALSE